MRVMAIGTVMVDILAVELPAIAAPGAVVYAPREVETRIGGHPVDVAIDLVRLGSDPAEVAVVAALGVGMYGRYVRSVIEDYGLTGFLQTVLDTDSGKNLVLEVVGEDRRFHIDPGANWALDPLHVAAALDRWKPDVVSIRPGYCGIDLDLATALAPVGDALVLLDVMQPHPSRPSGYLEGALRRTDVVHCNEIEALVATGAGSVHDAVSFFFEHGVALVLITRGGAGATAYTRTHVIDQPGYLVDVVDATGCGDAFCAGFVAGLATPAAVRRDAQLDPEDVARSLLSAQAVGASAATAVGCVEGVSASLVDQITAQQGEGLLGATDITYRNEP